MQYSRFSKDDLDGMERIYRLSLINSISGYKPANLIGTRAADGQENLAIFSSAIHLGSDPALIGLVSRPTTVERHTLDNIHESQHYSINHVPVDAVGEAHYTSAKWERGTSEFAACGFEAEYTSDFPVPMVKGSPIRMIAKLVEEIPIKSNGTLLIVGQVLHLEVTTSAIDEDGSIDLASAGTAAISGLNSYYEAKRIAKYPYARVNQEPKNILY